MALTTSANHSTKSQIYVPPNVQLNGAALTSNKIKCVYGYTAFIQLGFNVAKNEQTEVKYSIKKGRLIPIRAADNTYLGLNVVPFVRKFVMGGENEDLNFLDVEIPKFIRWYLWNEETQDQAKIFFENLALKGLIFLKDVSYKGKELVQERISYWIKLIEIGVATPISKEQFTKGLNGFLAKHGALNDKIIETTAYLNEVDTTFGKEIRELVKNEDLKRINNLFEKAYSKQTEQIPLIENEINNSYTRYFNKVRAATRQTISITEMHNLEKTSHQIVQGDTSESEDSEEESSEINSNQEKKLDKPAIPQDSSATSPVKLTEDQQAEVEVRISSSLDRKRSKKSRHNVHKQKSINEKT